MQPASLLVLCGACAAIGVVGAMLGLGGGILLVPLLVLAYGVDQAHAAGTSFVVVLATSAAGSVALDRSRLADPRLVANLSAATVVGAIIGGALLPIAPLPLVRLLFAAMALVAAVRLLRARTGAPPPPPAAEPAPLRGLWLGQAGCVVAGILSGLLGVGGAPIQVPLMHEVMGVPLPVAFATSNVMVGITAAASLAVASSAGLVRADLAAPCALAAAAGAYVGGRLAPKARPRPLVWLFAAVLVYVTGSMVWKAIASPG